MGELAEVYNVTRSKKKKQSSLCSERDGRSDATSLSALTYPTSTDQINAV